MAGQLRSPSLGASLLLCLEVFSPSSSLSSHPHLCSLKVGGAAAGEEAEVSAALEAIQGIPLSFRRSKKMSMLGV